MKRYRFLLMMGLVMLISPFAAFLSGIANTVYAANDYPFGYLAKGATDPLGFAAKNCTSYVAWRMNRDRGVTAAPWSFYNTMQGPNGKYGKFSNANNWDNNAVNIGFIVKSTPQIGDVAVWESNSGGAGSVGHVAYVESVNSDGSVNISEYNWNGGDGKYGERRNVRANKYITVNGRAPLATPCRTNGQCPIYRLWNQRYLRHFFTANYDEMSKVLLDVNWKYEGVAFYSYKTTSVNGQTLAVSPVYRLWNQSTLSHYYTISENEMNGIIASNSGWKLEGVAYYAYPSQVTGSSPVYKFYNSTTYRHFFTINDAEKNGLMSDPNWKFEGVVYYAFK